MKKIIETKYILDEKDAKTIAKALQYCLHRLATEPNCGAKCISKKEMERLLEEFDEYHYCLKQNGDCTFPDDNHEKHPKG